jgi:hypothetical protein
MPAASKNQIEQAQTVRLLLLALDPHPPRKPFQAALGEVAGHR